MLLRQITDSSLAQNAYLIGCPRSGEAIVIDPERDVDRYLALAKENGLRLIAVAETHIHADYLSGARELVERHGATAYLSAEGGPDWQFEWAKDHPNARFLRDGDTFKIGNIELKALLTPGHTPEHLSFLVTDLGGGADAPIALLSGDFIFVGDVGRPDLLESAAGQKGAREPAARALYESLRRTHELPGHLQILPAHGAGSACGKALGAVPVSVLDYERRFNGALRQALCGSEADFVHDILSGQPEPPLYFARMKRDNRRGPALLPDGHPFAPPRIDPAGLRSWIGSPGRVALDLRHDRAAFMARHLPGSLFTPMPGGKLPIAAGSYVDENAEVLLLAHDATEAGEATRQLLRIGLDHVRGWLPVDEALASESLTESLPRIETKDLATALGNSPGAAVLDVRSADEFSTSHVSGAQHIPYTRLAEHQMEIPADRPLFVHCGSGLRASLAVSFLATKDFQPVLVDGDFADIPGELLE